MDKFAKAQKTLEKLMESESMPNRIAGHCVWCIYDPTVKGTWQKQVEACDLDACPLHAVRMKAIERKD